MRIFQQREVQEAQAHAAAGGQALHLHRCIPDPSTAPRCFVQAVDRGEAIAHLFDKDARRLELTVRRLGVRVVVIEHRGKPGQHVDLCGAPLQRARAMADLEGPAGAPVPRRTA